MLLFTVSLVGAPVVLTALLLIGKDNHIHKKVAESSVVLAGVMMPKQCLDNSVQFGQAWWLGEVSIGTTLESACSHI